MDRIRRLPLPALLPIVFVVVGGLYFALGLLTDPRHLNVVVRLIGALVYAIGITVFFGITIARRRRKAGGADEVAAMLRTTRTGTVPDGVDTVRWTAELERYRVRYRRNRWSLPILVGLFVALTVWLALTLDPVWWLFLAVFVGLFGYALWETRRALRNLDRALDELRRRPMSLGPSGAGPTVPGTTPGASWTLPDAPADDPSGGR